MNKLLLTTTLVAGLLAACGDPSLGGDDAVDPPDGGPAPVASLEVTAPATLLAPGATLQLTATAFDADGAELEGRAITWSTSAPGVATVSATGLVTAHLDGAVIIEATSEGVRGDVALTVVTDLVPVARVEILSGDFALDPEATTTLTAIAYAADGSELAGREITWAAGDDDIATVSASGVVTAIGEGRTSITATCEGQTDDVSVTVEPAVVPVGWIEITSGPAIELDEGTSTHLNLVVHAEDGSVLHDRLVGWWSTAPSVATVNDFGWVAGASEGAATIWANVEGKTASIDVTVLRPVAFVELSQTAAVLTVFDAIQVEALPRDADGVVLDREVTWSTDDPTVATVTANGVVGAHAVGQATITATSGGRSASLTVDVTTWDTDALLSIDGQPLPATLFEYTEEDEHGVTATILFQVLQGELRMHGIDPRYELWAHGWIHLDGEPVDAATFRSSGTWEAVEGGYLFTDEVGAAIPVTVNPDQTLSVVWQADPAAPPATLVFGTLP